MMGQGGNHNTAKKKCFEVNMHSIVVTPNIEGTKGTENIKGWAGYNIYNKMDNKERESTKHSTGNKGLQLEMEKEKGPKNKMSVSYPVPLAPDVV